MLTCREVSRDLASNALGTAGFGRRLAIRMHLLMCENCRKFAREIEELGVAMRRLAATGERDASDVAAQERILARLQETRAPGEGGGRAG